MCAARYWSGLTKADEVKPRATLRDTRTISKRFYDFLEKPKNCGSVLLFMAAAIIFFSNAADLIFLFGLLIFWRGVTRHPALLVRLPMRAKVLDYNDLKAGTESPQLARGIYYYGNDIDSNQEIWFSDADMRTHTLIFGSTGSGKTEALISLAFNALIQGSGFIYIDGKGDNSLFAKIFSLVRSMGREDDLLLINFMTGARDIIGPQSRRLSNTFNPFANGSSSMLSQLVVSLMASASHTPDGDMWKGRAIAFVEALMKLLVYMRDKGKILLDANTIRHYFSLEFLESIVIDKVFPRTDQEPVSLADAPTVVWEPLYNYVINLPGYDKARKGKQVSQVLEQHGFITMQLVRVFTSLADTYGHILRTKLAEVDLRDIVLNRRILVVLLPALEKSPDELANLGKVIIASLRAMMAAGLGEEVEGAYKDLITKKPTNASTPFLCVLDEYGYYAVQGFAVVPAQARSLGFSVIFAGQDLPAFQKASKEEAASIGANTNIKIAMKLEDPHETYEFFSKTAGTASVGKVDKFSIDPNSVIFTYRDDASASIDQRSRITMGDLKKQREGEAHVFFRGDVMRIKFFHADPKPVKQMKLNHLLKIEMPPGRQLSDLEKQIERFNGLVKKGDLDLSAPEFNPDINLVAETLQKEAVTSLIEKGVSALLAIYNRLMKVEQKVPVEEEVVSTDEIHVFARPLLADSVKQMVSTNDWAAFSSALLQKNISAQQIEFIERLFGRTETDAHNVASELIRDMELATNYPPIIAISPDLHTIVKAIEEIVESLRSMKA